MSIDYPKLILPKPHLSWSQLNMWVTNRERYKREYFDAAQKLDTRYLRFGKGVAEMVEELCFHLKMVGTREKAVDMLAQKWPMTEDMRKVMMELEIEGISEYQIGNSGAPDDPTPICKVGGIVPILCYLDKYVDKHNAIREYKTGKVEWTKAKVQKHDQLLYYAVGLMETGKPMPLYADLDWIETKETETERVDFWRDGDKIVEVTGRIKSFHREFDEREIERMRELIIRVGWEISDAYQENISQL